MTWREFKQHIEDQNVKDYDEIIILVPAEKDQFCHGITSTRGISLRQHLDTNENGSSTWDIGAKYDA